MSRIGEDGVVDLLKRSVGEVPHPPDRYDRVIRTAQRAQRRRATRTLGAASLSLAMLGSAVVMDRIERRGDPVTVLVAAADRAEELGTSRVAGTGKFDLGPIEMDTTITGTVDFQAGRSSMTMLTAMPGGPSITQRSVQDGAVTYQSTDPAPAPLPAGKRWIRSALPPSLQVGGANADPRATLDAMRTSSKEVTTVGRETVRGIRATRYRFVPDLAAAGVPADVGDVSMEAWIDRDGLPRRIRMSVDTSELMASMVPQASPETSGGGFTLTLEFFDYGVPVDITIPPAAEVIDATDPRLGAAGIGTCMTAEMQRIFAEQRAGGPRSAAPDELPRLIQAASEKCERQAGSSASPAAAQ